jgi:hypothetical protein
VLRWDFLPEGTLRRHRNPKPLPSGFKRIDDAPVHEHPTVQGQYGPYSRPIRETSTQSHHEAFLRFCERANIDPRDAYAAPPEPQLPLIR